MRKILNFIDSRHDCIATRDVFFELTGRLAWFIVTTSAALALILTGCHDKEATRTGTTNQNLLVVERQTIDLGWDASITVDAPVGGPSHLQDSVNKFLNNEIYQYYLMFWKFGGQESADPQHIFDEQMYDENGTFFDLDIFPYAFHQLENVGGIRFSIASIAQTESFVTYGIEDCHCGGKDSCGSKFHCHTFSKKDGHRIQDIISWGDILRFINDHPDAKHPFGQRQIETNNINPESLFDAGLTENGLLVVNEDEANHYVLGMLAYEDVLPYLSQEAQELVKAIDRAKEHNREDWYMGRCIGQIGDTLLMQREPQWQGFAKFNCVDEKAFQCDKVYTISAYTRIGDQYFPQKIFDLKADRGTGAQNKWAEEQLNQQNCKRYSSRLEFEFPNGAWNGPTFNGEYFIANGNVLLVPYKKEDYVVDFVPLQFDGHKYKVVEPEKTKPSGTPLGKIELGDKESIYLVETTDAKAFSTNIPGVGFVANGVTAYHVQDNLYIPAKIFPYYSSTARYLPGKEPLITSNPNKGFTAFDSVNKKLYVAISERTSLGGYGCFDRYDVYRFDGEKFDYNGEDGGFWLHPSIRKFARLDYVGKSADYLVRIDEMRSYNWRYMDEDEYETLTKTDTCRYRLTLWKGKDNMSDVPDVVVENGYYSKDGSVFHNKDYKYVINYDENGGLLRVYKGGKCVHNQNLRNVIY